MPNHKLIMPAVILCVICLITTGLLSLTYELTREQRAKQEEAAANANRLALFPEAAGFLSFDLPEPGNIVGGLKEIMQVQSSDGKSLGYLVVGERRGYGGQVPVMIAISNEGIISGVRVLSNEETPGLGKKVEGSAFLQQFFLKPADRKFALSAQSGQDQQVDAISGATISSRAVTEAVNIAVLTYTQLEGEQ